MKNPIYVFDFDGVLFDSHKEQALTAYNTVQNTLINSLNKLPAGYVDRYCKYRALVSHTPHDINMLADWSIFHFLDVPFEDFPALFEEWKNTRAHINAKREDFFEKRRLVEELDPKSWCEISKPFETAWNTLLQHKDEPLIIMTKKNFRATKLLCEYYGYTFKPSDRIFSGEEGKAKSIQFQELFEEFPDSEFIFVDDALENLEDVSSVFGDRVQYWLATWGYNLPIHHQQAEERGFKLAKQEDILLSRIYSSR
jgi:phosphoglycolate phosphatase-like HAD superfamily hydrolase